MRLDAARRLDAGVSGGKGKGKGKDAGKSPKVFAIIRNLAKI
jgi:hypothetical protein